MIGDAGNHHLSTDLGAGPRRLLDRRNTQIPRRRHRNRSVRDANGPDRALKPTGENIPGRQPQGPAKHPTPRACMSPNVASNGDRRSLQRSLQRGPRGRLQRSPLESPTEAPTGSPLENPTGRIGVSNGVSNGGSNGANWSLHLENTLFVLERYFFGRTEGQEMAFGLIS